MHESSHATALAHQCLAAAAGVGQGGTFPVGSSIECEACLRKLQAGEAAGQVTSPACAHPFGPLLCTQSRSIVVYAAS